MATTMNGTIYTSEEAAKVLGITEGLVCRYCRMKKLKANRIGRSWIIAKDELQRFKRVPREVGNPQFKKQSR